MRGMAQKHGLKKLDKLLYKLSLSKCRGFSRDRLVKKIEHRLCSVACETLMREIYEKMIESQREYPLAFGDDSVDNDILAVRSEIERLMHERGYEGSYPEFVKRGNIRDVRLGRSYGLSYFVGFEKNSEHRIKVVERIGRDVCSLQLVCGCALHKKNENIRDIWSCSFNAKGRRFINSVEYTIDDETGVDLPTIIDIAVKRAELRTLDDREKRILYPYMPSAFSIFLLVFVVMGGSFGIIMTLASMLLCVICLACFGQLSLAGEMMRVIPWWLVLAIGWVGFGASMGVIEARSMRK